MFCGDVEHRNAQKYTAWSIISRLEAADWNHTVETFVGNLVEVPEFSTQGQDGKHFVRLRLAVSESYRDTTGQWQTTEPVFWSCEAWRHVADGIRATGAGKGQAVIVVGSIRQSNWTDEQSGQTCSRKFVEIKHFGLDATRKPKTETPQSPVPQEDYTAPQQISGAWEQAAESGQSAGVNAEAEWGE